jgi:hypothetical protein
MDRVGEGNGGFAQNCSYLRIRTLVRKRDLRYPIKLCALLPRGEPHMGQGTAGLFIQCPDYPPSQVSH